MKYSLNVRTKISILKVIYPTLTQKTGLKGFIPFSPLVILSLFVPIPFPGIPNQHFSGVPGNH